MERDERRRGCDFGVVIGTPKSHPSSPWSRRAQPHEAAYRPSGDKSGGGGPGNRPSAKPTTRKRLADNVSGYSARRGALPRDAPRGSAGAPHGAASQCDVSRDGASRGLPCKCVASRRGASQGLPCNASRRGASRGLACNASRRVAERRKGCLANASRRGTPRRSSSWRLAALHGACPVKRRAASQRFAGRRLAMRRAASQPSRGLPRSASRRVAWPASQCIIAPRRSAPQRGAPQRGAARRVAALRRAPQCFAGRCLAVLRP